MLKKKKQYALLVNYEMSNWVQRALNPHMFPMKNSGPASPEWSEGTIYRFCKMLLAVFSILEYQQFHWLLELYNINFSSKFLFASSKSNLCTLSWVAGIQKGNSLWTTDLFNVQGIQKVTVQLLLLWQVQYVVMWDIA